MRMAESHRRPGAREVRDVYGRRYHVGESDRAVLGYSRGWVLAAVWLAMLAVSANQYDYGVLAPRLAAAHGWGLRPVLWAFALWVLCHAAAAWVVSRLRRHRLLAARQVATLGILLCALGLLALGHLTDPALALVGYAVAGGLGTGLVYRTCLATVAAWYPDRPGRVAAVSGAFSYGAVPLILVLAQVSDLGLALDQTAFGLLAVVLVCAAVLDEPPAHWWPAHVDPRRWALDRAVNPALRHDRPALRQYSTAELPRCPTTWLMSGMVACVSAVALFDIACLALLALADGWSLPVAATVPAAFAAGSGAVRGVAVRAAGRVGRPRVLGAAVTLAAVAQLAVLGASAHHLLVALLLAAACAGAGTGTLYALFPGLVRSHFGDRPGLPNLWLLYPAKAVGGVLGIGGGGLLVVAGHGNSPALALSAALCLIALGLARAVHQPGMPRTLPRPISRWAGRAG
jgi:MFS family permease